jgi:hypothetical protein
MVQEDESIHNFFWDINHFGRGGGILNVLESCLDRAANELSQVADEMLCGGRMELFQETSNTSNQGEAIERVLLLLS